MQENQLKASLRNLGGYNFAKSWKNVSLKITYSNNSDSKRLWANYSKYFIFSRSDDLVSVIEIQSLSKNMGSDIFKN
ncbi:hypothetical protein DASC09_052490 [Saccharomycopsis crataegensis]|uniref:Uncharacterized protein n=1 Tax=Saccharomycopsis crataegensis TaxID=43959 RepID=A0AAV5QT35_9ASCO|nr:hypothetical protein DASC09_052490 [Saccharomycopsis crataegensis]